jgi:hypothetical protein
MATTPEQRDEAALNQVKIAYPDYRNEADVQLPPNQPLEDSYRDQWYAFRGSSNFELRPSAEVTHEPVPEVFGNFPAYIISAWNPRGIPQIYSHNLNRGKEFGHRIARRAIDFVKATTFAVDGGWLEESVVVNGISEERAIEYAADLGQPALVRWDAQHLTVIPTEGSSVPPSQTGWSLTTLEKAPCPMRLANRDAQCVPAGGPWVSASQKVGGIWQQHRGMAMSAVGCGVCDTGAKVLSGANGLAIPIVHLNVGSRYGSYFFSKRLV